MYLDHRLIPASPSQEYSSIEMRNINANSVQQMSHAKNNFYTID